MLRAVATVILLLAGLAACGAPPRPAPPPASDPAVGALGGHRRAHRASTEGAALLVVPRPEIAALASVLAIPEPDPSDHLRWPLTANRHPALEPSYAIAPVFAAASVSWEDLCRLGAQNRRTSGALVDQTEYLKAWCDVSRREIASAVTRLGALLHSPVLGLPAAVRSDIANILVDAGDADQALRVLASARVSDVTVLDLLAASYIEVGKVRDGVQLNELAIGSYDFLHPADQCERLTRRLLLASVEERALAVPDYTPYVGNQSCMHLATETACWAKRDCIGYLITQGVPATKVGVASLYFTWPDSSVPAATWQELANLASRELDVPGADLLAVAAGEGALRSAGCDRGMVDAVRRAMLRVKLADPHDATLNPRLDMLIDTPQKLCGDAAP